VLLIPAVFFFGVGTVAGVVATVIYAMPPPVRLTAHGLEMVERQMVEAGEAFGCTRIKLLLFVKIPLAFRTIMAGVNQCIMMALSMVIIASMIGAGGLGDEIVRAISRLQIGRGVEGGLVVVVLAILLDRLSKGIGVRADPTA
jgi:glycine betaine/proline transport system permease protein